ncbi:aldehyde dehydrogenase (NADP(+)) [Notoacmeibacter sp. MSK16QG-6]|uniref:aldehyde dehydrogenase (NADP(+)) n=1 Tax=Notoacmeibacter sp. MSK16QG-6 TaxID=2957982 RepID=UPI00209E026C|nr:aldehyde dehydrogenase (NADP(+)) [Notoacmeibacter sp. MSK16QG-6]MCP1200264.1 aldehyde dehydrogenase (NADP(+)) [Notoacmeibacter sp. MSK16QG-6]
MIFTGRHLIAGEWADGGPTFTSDPVTGDPLTVFNGGRDEVDRAAKAAEAAFRTFGWTSREERARFLEAIADAIEARGEEITAIGTAETGLLDARLNGERGRTTGQLRLFAKVLREGDYLDRRYESASDANPDLRLMQRPFGPVGVFGASNFPLAFSVAGGDTASALAAGCPVIVKGHPAHPGTGEIVADAILDAMKTCGLPKGTFQFVQSNSREAGEALVTHPLITAVGFTGSLGVGRSLFDLACRRDTPIPFYGELGSINPVFCLPAAMAKRAGDIGSGWAGSLTMGVGQFCTNPGVLIAKESDALEILVTAADSALADVDDAPMLTQGIAQSYREGRNAAVDAGAEAARRSGGSDRRNAPDLLRVSGTEWLSNSRLHEEVFGPFGIVVAAQTEDQMIEIAERLEGQLTASIHLEDGDEALGQHLLPILERKAGRILANGWPTGVAVSPAMMHGGPYPATTVNGTTSVGTLAIQRFLRPVCYQNIPQALLPADLAK